MYPIVKCLACGNEQELKSYSRDELGYCTTCLSCGSSFDIDEPENEKLITERCLIFKVAGENETYKCTLITNLFVENDIDYVCYLDDVKTSGCYPSFIVRKSGKKWNDILELINSIKACVYRYKNETFYITSLKRNSGVIGNIQSVVIL